MAEKFVMNPEPVRGLAREVYGISDALGNIYIDAVLHEGASACEGTALVAGLRTHAEEQHGHVQQLAEQFDASGSKILKDVETFLRCADSLSPTPQSPGDRDL